MIDAEVRKFILEEIRKQMNVLLPAETGETATHTETIEKLYPGMPNVPSRPIVQPYGVSSRAPRGTQSVTGRMGEHVGNRVVLGHRDSKKPAVEEGEIKIYSNGNSYVYAKKDGSVISESSGGTKVTLTPAGKIRIENDSVELLERLVFLLETLIDAYVLTALGPMPFWDPTLEELLEIKTDLETLKDG